MPFLAPSFARLPPLDYLLADQVDPRKKIARHLGVSLAVDRLAVRLLVEPDLD